MVVAGVDDAVVAGVVAVTAVEAVASPLNVENLVDVLGGVGDPFPMEAMSARSAV